MTSDGRLIVTGDSAETPTPGHLMPYGITVLRVLHTARDIPGILAEQFVIED